MRMDTNKVSLFMPSRKSGLQWYLRRSTQGLLPSFVGQPPWAAPVTPRQAGFKNCNPDRLQILGSAPAWLSPARRDAVRGAQGAAWGLPQSETLGLPGNLHTGVPSCGTA